jgi:hypothetical protein
MFHRSIGLFAALGLVLAASVSFSGEVAPAGGPQRFGAPLKVKKAVDVAVLAAAPAKFKGRTIRLEGTVKEVCQGRGCWVEVSDEKGASFMARSLDESVLLPKDCKGARVVVEGKVVAMPAKLAEEPESKDHACPKPTYVVSTRGVELTPAR